jgi:hypothetical protein
MNIPSRPGTPHALRQAADVALGQPIGDHIWEALVEEGFVGTCLDEDLSDHEYETYFTRLLDAASLARRVAGRQQRQPHMDDTAPPDRGDPVAALVRLQAEEAAQHPNVRWLWQEAFGGRLLAKGEERVACLLAAADRCGATLGGLGKFIADLAEELATRYHWPVGGAETFLFTGEPPSIPRWKMRNSWYKDAPLLSTIIIEANIGLKPKDLAKAFGVYQRLLFQFHRLRNSNRRRRSLSEKHQELAIFAASRRDLSGATAMAEWNRTHPEWAYRSVPNFQRDRMAALRRMFGEGERRRAGA